MEQLTGNAVIGQSGGPTAAINATLAGVIRGAYECPLIKKVYGMFNGIQGALEDKLCTLNYIVKSESDLSLLENTPAAALGSCRMKLPAFGEDDSVYQRLLKVFRRHDIRYFFYIGGNDSMDTVAKLSFYMNSIGYDMRIIGVPKTIDCDLSGTDHTPGYGSAAKYIATTMQELMRDTSVYTVKAVTVVEIMGRDAGWLTAAAALPSLYGNASPDLVYLPEVPFDMDRFFSDISSAFEKHPNVVVAVSEGVRTEDGKYVGEGLHSGSADVFGHKYLSGTGKALELAIKENFGCKTRTVELNLPQRCASHIASATDIKESVMIGRHAVKAAADGCNGKMAVFIRESTSPYVIRTGTCDIAGVANAVKRVPREFINENGNGVTEECLRYIAPLIEGEVFCLYEHGIPRHFVIRRDDEKCLI